MKKIGLEEYKKMLIGYYRQRADENTYEKRKRNIETKYSDEFLDRVVLETKEFISFLLNKINTEKKTVDDLIFFKLERPVSLNGEELCDHISNGCYGGWYSDNLYSVICENKIISVSDYLLRSFFGENFKIYWSSEIQNRYTSSETAGCEYPLYYLCFIGPVQEFNQILNDVGSLNGDFAKHLRFPN